MPRSFMPCAVYAFGLSLLIFSHRVTYGILEVFIAKPYVLGTHTEDWMSWHAVGCFFVGLLNLQASRWSEAGPRASVAGATAIIFGTWAVQNFRLMFTGRFTSLMWLNVVGCALAAIASILCGASLRRHGKRA